MQASHGYLKSPEELHPEESLHRTTASVLYHRALASDRHFDASLVWGHNRTGGASTHAVLLEANWDVTARNAIFGRAEWVQKTGEELAVLPESKKFGLTSLTVGATHELLPGRSYSVALGASVTYTFAPSSLDEFYGEHPLGCWVFFRIRPAAMKHEAMAHHGK
jgi:hypothetical protein